MRHDAHFCLYYFLFRIYTEKLLYAGPPSTIERPCSISLSQLTCLDNVQDADGNRLRSLSLCNFKDGPGSFNAIDNLPGSRIMEFWCYMRSWMLPFVWFHRFELGNPNNWVDFEWSWEFDFSKYCEWAYLVICNQVSLMAVWLLAVMCM